MSYSYQPASDQLGGGRMGSVQDAEDGGNRRTNGVDARQPGRLHETQLREFLLRCWQREEATSGRQPGWRFSLVEVGAARREHEFETLEELIAFLCKESGAGNRAQR